MKTKICAIIISILFLFTSISFAERDKRKGNKKNRGKQQGQNYNKRGRGYQQDQRHDNRGRKYNNRDHYYQGQNRHHSKHRRHIPNYRRHRHWKRYGDWDRHYRQNRHRYPGGRYERDSQGNLMFSFCQDSRDTSTCVSFGFYY